MRKLSVMSMLFGMALVVNAAALAAEEYRVGAIVVENPWARATAKNAKSGAAYGTIRNTASEPDRLIGIKGTIAKTIHLHKSIMENGVMMMLPVADINLPPGGEVALAPGGFHIMLMGLKSRLREGASFPLTLIFKKAGAVRVDVKIMKAGAMGAMKMKPVE